MRKGAGVDVQRAKVMGNFTTESEECCLLKFSPRTWVAETVSTVHVTHNLTYTVCTTPTCADATDVPSATIIPNIVSAAFPSRPDAYLETAGKPT